MCSASKHAPRPYKRVSLQALALATSVMPAAAEEPRPSDATPNRYYFYSGVDAARDTSYGWAGAAWAPFAPMDRAGLRLRAQGGGGRYRYETSAVPGGWNWGTKIEGEVLAGWQFLAGPQALALYGGVNLVDNRLDYPDPTNPDQGTQFGAKAVAEYYARIGDEWIATASASFSTANLSSTARATFARALPGGWELGIEAAGSNDRLDSDARGGLFLGMPLFGRALRLAGGWRWSSDSDDGVYGTLSFFMPY